VGASEFSSVNPRLMQTIQRYMEALRRSADGSELYGLLGRILHYHGRQGPIDDSCFAELYDHLDTYARDTLALPNARIKARLLQQHIAPYLSDVTAAPLGAAAYSAPRPTPDALDLEPAREGTLHARLSAAQERRERYAALQRSEQNAWRAIYGVVRDVSALKQVWDEALDVMATDRNRLEQRLSDSEHSLAGLEASARQLRADLEAARQAPARRPVRRLARGATRVVTREAFSQQLQSEVSRLKRSGGSAALALLAIDDLAQVAREHGDAAEMAVLNAYARGILCGFRSYDVIAQHEHGVFAVLLPDTGADGAQRALEKAKNRAAQTHLEHGARRFALPAFRGATTSYVAGEEPLHWLQRAEAALGTTR
jgi:GGDEF domain-containing protein